MNACMDDDDDDDARNKKDRRTEGQEMNSHRLW